MAVTACESTMLVTVQAAVTTTTGAGVGGTSDKFIVSSGALTYTIGSGSGQVNKEYNIQFNEATATTVNYDLSGALANRAGDSAIFTSIRLFYMKNTSTAANLTIGGGSNPAPLPQIVLPPGAEILIRARNATGWAITAGTADIFKVVSDAVNGTADICIAGI